MPYNLVKPDHLLSDIMLSCRKLHLQLLYLQLSDTQKDLEAARVAPETKLSFGTLFGYAMLTRCM